MCVVTAGRRATDSLMLHVLIKYVTCIFKKVLSYDIIKKSYIIKKKYTSCNSS